MCWLNIFAGSTVKDKIQNALFLIYYTNNSLHIYSYFSTVKVQKCSITVGGVGTGGLDGTVGDEGERTGPENSRGSAISIILQWFAT